MMQEKDNHMTCKMIQNVETCTTNICKCVSVKGHQCCTHCIVECSWEEWQEVLVWLKDVETSMWFICSPSDLCLGSDTRVRRCNPCWQCRSKCVVHQRPPMIYVGGWMLDGDESRMLHSQHIHAVKVEMMVKTFQRYICICWVGM